MNNRNVVCKCVAVVLCAVFGIGVFAQDLDRTAVLRSIDEFNRFNGTDFSGEFTIVSDDPDEDRSVFKTRLFRRDDEEKFLFLILDPTLRKGEGYLQVEDTGWAYDPESREFSVFNLSDSFQDTESRNSDFAAANYEEDYRIEQYRLDKLGKFDVYVLDLRATNDSVAYPRIIMWVRQDNYLPLKTEDYSLSNRLLRTSFFPSYAQQGQYFVPTKMLFIDNLNPGERTEVSVRDVSFNNIPDNVFTRSYLEQVNR